MKREFDLSLRPEPFWLQEAFSCMNYIPALDGEEWLNKNDGRSRQQKEDFLLPYRNYRDTMRDRLQPIMVQFALLAGYVDTTPRNQQDSKRGQPPIMLFLVQVQHLFEGEELPDGEVLEAELNQAFQRILGTGPRDASEGEPAIRGLPDVIAALDGWQGNDADKLKLLRLYSERHEVMEQLWGFQESCIEVGCECLESVRERFDACMEELKKPDTVKNLFESVGVQDGGKFSGQITPVILPFNDCLIGMQALPGHQQHFKLTLHVGIETFPLCRSGETGYCNDEQLLSRLKALGDPTRLKILRLLVERPYYLQEMSKALGLTSATVLHHIGILMSEELIELLVTTEKRKVYYQIKKHILEEVSQGILQLAMTQEEREEQRKRQMLEGHLRK